MSQLTFVFDDFDTGPEPAEILDLAIPRNMPERMGNCGIVAVARMADVSHDEALAAIPRPKNAKTFGTGRGKWCGSTNIVQREDALKALGFEPSTTRLKRGQRMQVRTFIRKHEKTGTRYMMRVSGHAFVIFRGKLYDQCHHGVDVDRTPFARCIVTHFTTVERKDK